MVFGIDDALGIASAGLGILGGGKGKSMKSQPIYDPRANELLDLLTGRAKGLMQTPYQSPALLRYEPKSVFQQSPVLQAIQDAVDRSMTNAGQGASSQATPVPAPAQPGMQFDNPFFKGFAEGDPRKGTMAEAYSGNSFMRSLGKMGGVAPMAAYFQSMQQPQGAPQAGEQPPQQAGMPQGAGQPKDYQKYPMTGTIIDLIAGAGGSNMGPRTGQGAADGFSGGGGGYIGNLLKTMGA